MKLAIDSEQAYWRVTQSAGVNFSLNFRKQIAIIICRKGDLHYEGT